MARLSGCGTGGSFLGECLARTGEGATGLSIKHRLQQHVTAERSKDIDCPAVTLHVAHNWCLCQSVLQVLTFDDYGVSGHPNHRAVYRGVSLACSTRVVCGHRKSRLATASSNLAHRDGHASETSADGLPATNVCGTEFDVWVLQSTNLLRKYIGILDIPFAALFHRRLFVQLNAHRVWRGMAMHHSQFVWYRKLFVLFSRYAYINTFETL